MENREQEIEKASKDCKINSLWQSSIDGLIVESFTNGAKWADEHPINAWHDLKKNPEDLPALDKDGLSDFVLLYIKNIDGPTYYNTGYYREKDRCWDDCDTRDIDDDGYINVIAWKDLDIFEE